jgi:hypothetical protein
MVEGTTDAPGGSIPPPGASTRERLLARRLPVVEHRIRVDFDAPEDDPDAWVTLALRAIPPKLGEDLIDAHPPTAREREADPLAQWSRASYVPALLAACSVDPDLDEAFWWMLWANERADGEPDDVDGTRIATGEVWAMFTTCQQLNDRSPEVRTGKGSTPTAS